MERCLHHTADWLNQGPGSQEAAEADAEILFLREPSTHTQTLVTQESFQCAGYQAWILGMEKNKDALTTYQVVYSLPPLIPRPCLSVITNIILAIHL